ncbi:MAG: hypothetical protein GY884_36420 [Proteobacteria bacterium]|nr:hypothetical protein [Pseudomonadota bacterium]
MKLYVTFKWAGEIMAFGDEVGPWGVKKAKGVTLSNQNDSHWAELVSFMTQERGDEKPTPDDMLTIVLADEDDNELNSTSVAPDEIGDGQLGYVRLHFAIVEPE